MSWQEVATMSLRAEFVQLASQAEANMAQLCRRYGISRKTGYKWLGRYREQGRLGLADQSRRPHHSPKRTPATMEERILTVRDAHPAWGGRKVAARLQQLGEVAVPTPSTITAVLHRHDAIDALEAAKHQPWRRFERTAPNELWQMDFKGHVPMARGGRCHPLTVLDDHSRFAVGLEACPDERTGTVQERLTRLFRCYGLPAQMLMDNGSPWGRDDYSVLVVWLLRLGVAVSHGRPYHPQTQGKDERFHRTLKLELLAAPPRPDVAAYQQAFDRWRAVYNLERPHEALGLVPPVTRYHPSPRAFPEALPSIEYPPGDTVRRVQAGGEVFFHNHAFPISKAFRGQPVALRPTQQDGLWDVFFCTHCVAQIDLRSPLPK
jgi:transposase InsO family protein